VAGHLLAPVSTFAAIPTCPPLGRWQLATRESRLRRSWPQTPPPPSLPPRRGWKRSIVEARSVLENKLSASIRRDVEQQLPRLYRAARRAAILGLEEYEEAEAARLLPEMSPWSLQDVLRDDWYPEGRLP
jgi:Domain of unknown function DUF29